MTMELVKDVLKVSELKGKGKAETLVEAEMYLNHTKPEVDKILWTDGKPEVMSVNIVPGRMIVSGIVEFKTVYKAKEEEFGIYSVETTVDFKEEVEIEGINEDMLAIAKTNLEYIEHELSDERKISLKALVNVEGKVESVNNIEIVTDIKGEDGIQVLKEKIDYKENIASEESYLVVREAFELDEGMPPIDEILKVQLNVYEEETKVVEDRVIISGIMECTFVYLGGEKLNSIEKEISFNHFIDMPGVEKDLNCELDLKVDDGNYELKEDLEGELRIVDLEAKISMKGRVYEEKEKEIVVDAYSTKKKVNIEKEEIEVSESIKDFIFEENVEGEIQNKAFKEIYSVEGKPVLIDNRYIDEKIVLEGFLSLNIIYLEEGSNEIKTIEEELPFKFYVDAEDIERKEIDIDVECRAENISYILKNGDLEVDSLIKSHVLVTDRKREDIVLDVEETDEIIDKKDRPSITIYIVQKDDDVWDIAKRYNTTVDDIAILNDLSSSDTLIPGEKIIIEKSIDMNF